MTARRPSRDQGGNQGNGGHWITTKRRHAIYARDGYRCAWCDLDLQGASNGNRTLDHVRPRSSFPEGSRGPAGPHASTNLVTACLACNTSRGTLAPLPWITLLLESMGLRGRALSVRRARVLDRVLGFAPDAALAALLAFARDSARGPIS